VAFRPVAAELACVCKVAPWGGGSELGGGDEGCASGGEGCVSGGGGEGRGGEGVDGGASGGGAVDFGKGGEGVPAEMLPVVGGIIGGDGGGRTTGGGGDVRGGKGWHGPQPTRSVLYAHVVISELEPPSSQSSQKHVSKQMSLPGVNQGGEPAVGSGSGCRMPQSVSYWPSGYSAPGPPLSHQLSKA
jgi:hypothetical protein